MGHIVNDIMTYNVLKRDPTSTLQTKNNNLVEKLFKNNVIDERDKQLLSKNAMAPRIY
ncbi:hypothetical protein PSTG_19790, partial [Puccinia striiformis f. sp. tritici PST-78]